jgi:uncharacterized protein YbaR (Trm112 family)
MTATKYPQGYFKDKACKTCGSVFTPTNPCNIYCSPKCKGKNSYYKRNYGITDADLAAMKIEQDNKCYLCQSEGFLIGKNNHNEKLAVDHCHKTGKVRKLLCHNCNRALGLFKDNPELMRKAADYIEENNCNNP